MSTGHNDNIAIKDGIHYIRSQQKNSGKFLAIASPSPLDFSSAHANPTPFLTSLILSSLRNLDGTDDIAKQATNYLLQQQTRNGVWNYWEPGSRAYKDQSYPDDLDDTACALLALQPFITPAKSGKLLAGLASALIHAEVKPGGPYRTWLVDTQTYPDWASIDPAVNANIGSCLHAYGVELPQLVKYFDLLIANNGLQSSFYITPIPIIYFLHRWYKGAGCNEILSVLKTLTKNSKSIYTPHLAMAISAGIAFGLPGDLLEILRAELLSRRVKNAWPAQAIYNEPLQNGIPYYAGSTELCTALAIEALNSLQLSSQQMIQPKITKVSLPTAKIQNNELHKAYTSYVQNVIANDSGQQICGAADITVKSLGSNLQTTVVSLLNSASLHGWCAYTIYDDILDLEHDPKRLAIANIAHRHMLHCFEGAVPNTKYMALVHKTLNAMDSANYWEVGNTRARVTKGVISIDALPDYGSHKVLAERSMGHALAPLGVYFAANIRSTDQRYKACVRFYKHFLIAKQLNDDAHDWEEDLQHGMLTSAVCIMLANEPKSFDIADRLPALRQKFWDQTITNISNQILDHCTLASQALAAAGMQDTTHQDSWIHALQNSAQKALKERDTTSHFLKAF